MHLIGRVFVCWNQRIWHSEVLHGLRQLLHLLDRFSLFELVFGCFIYWVLCVRFKQILAFIFKLFPLSYLVDWFLNVAPKGLHILLIFVFVDFFLFLTPQIRVFVIHSRKLLLIQIFCNAIEVGSSTALAWWNSLCTATFPGHIPPMEPVSLSQRTGLWMRKSLRRISETSSLLCPLRIHTFLNGQLGAESFAPYASVWFQFAVSFRITWLILGNCDGHAVRLVRRKQRILLQILLLVLAGESYARINWHSNAQIMPICLLRGDVTSLS